MKDYKKVAAMIVMGTIIATGMFAVDIGNGFSFNGFGLAGVSLAENQVENLAFGLNNSLGFLEAAYSADRGGAKMLIGIEAKNWTPLVFGFPYAYVNFFEKIFTISVGNNYEPLLSVITMNRYGQQATRMLSGTDGGIIFAEQAGKSMWI